MSSGSYEEFERNDILDSECEENGSVERIDEEMVEPGTIGTWNFMKLGAMVILMLLFTGFLIGLTIFVWPKGK